MPVSTIGLMTLLLENTHATALLNHVLNLDSCDDNGPADLRNSKVDAMAVAWLVW